MSAAENNILQNVQTYNMAGLEFLNNTDPSISIANKRFLNFQDMPGQLGLTTTFEVPPRFTSQNTIGPISFQAATQNVQSLTVNKQQSIGVQFTDQQVIYNDVENYMKRWGKAAIKQLGTVVARDINSNYVDHTYRCYGDGRSSISSYGAMAQALALFRDYGAVAGDIKVILPLIDEPAIVNTGLNQFTIDRNNKDANSWEVGGWEGVQFYRSNLLPTHTAGTAGTTPQVLTVVSVTQDSDNNITSITFGGCTNNDPNAIKAGDIITFRTVNYLQWIGYGASASRVQVRATSNVQANGSGEVTIPIYPNLVYLQGQNQNIASIITAGLLADVANSHRVGVIISGDSLFLAMPKLPTVVPYPSSSEQDDVTGVALRTYHGSQFGENLRGIVHDVIWGSTMVDNYCMRLAFPNS